MKRSSFFIVLVALILAGCTNHIIFEQNKDFVTQTWHKDSVLVFDVDVQDTLGVYNIYFNVRITGDYNNQSDYAYQNLFLFIDTEMPYENSIRDTLECILSKPSGEPYGKHQREWLGVGLGHIWAYKIGYRGHIRFPFKGNYHFKIQQAMRQDDLEHVLDAGITIEKVKN